MLTAALKIGDLALRSLFALLTLFLLPAPQAGQFGVLLTLCAFASFAIGYERYVDLQRRIGSVSGPEARQLLFSALRLNTLHALAIVPVFVVALGHWGRLDAAQVTYAVLVLIADQLASESYRVALTLPRYRVLMVCNLVRNTAALAAIGALSWRANTLALDDVLTAWGIVSLLTTVAFVAIGRPMLADRAGAFVPITRQWHDSATHFKIGLAALAALQADRLIAAEALGLEGSGVYFRHVFLASLSYQLFGIASFNRVLPFVYARLAQRDVSSAKSLLRREALAFVLLTTACVGSGGLLLAFAPNVLVRHPNIDPSYLLVLLVAFMFRGLADYSAMLLNGSFQEQVVFRSQLLAVATTVGVGLVAAPLLGIPGLLAATLAGFFLYAVLLYTSARRLNIIGST